MGSIFLGISLLIQAAMAAPPSRPAAPDQPAQPDQGDSFRSAGGAADLLGARQAPPPAEPVRDPNRIGIYCTDDYGTILSERDRGYQECLAELQKKRKKASK